MHGHAEAVVLVHGLWMHGIVFALQRRRLARQGLAVHAFSYPSVRGRLDANARALAGFVAALPAARIHLVGHSLGGLIVLSMLARHADPRIGRIVLMGTPYRGSHCARLLARVPALAGVVGRPLREWLATAPPPLPSGIDLGVISGSRGIGTGRLLPGLPKPNDGIVAVAETVVPHARDAITLHVSHSEMLVSRSCIDQVAAFLRSGRFEHGAP
jgi:pimeloyl-ACP methyl ester carboxylesterase